MHWSSDVRRILLPMVFCVALSGCAQPLAEPHEACSAAMCETVMSDPDRDRWLYIWFAILAFPFVVI